MKTKILIAGLVIIFLTGCSATAPPPPPTDVPTEPMSVQNTPTEEDSFTDEPVSTPRPTAQEKEPSSDRQTYQPENLRTSNGRIAVQLYEVGYSPEHLTLDLSVFTGPEFRLQGTSTVSPQMAYVQDLFLADQGGRKISAVLPSSQLLDVAESGAGLSNHNFKFDALPRDVDQITLTIPAISLMNIHSQDVFELSLEGKEPGDEWDLNQTVDVGPITYTFGETRLLESDDAMYTYRLEISYQSEAADPDGAQIAAGCPLVIRSLSKNFPPDLNSIGCDASKGVTFIEFGTVKQLGVPDLFRARAVATEMTIEGPWNLTWDVSPPSSQDILPAPIPIENESDEPEGCWNTKKLEWKESPDSTEIQAYYVRVAYQASDGEYERAVEFGPIQKTFYEMPVDCGRVFRWGVRAVDEAGAFSGWSPWVVDESGVPPG